MKKPFAFGATVFAGILVLSAFTFKDDLFELRKNFEIFGALYEEIALYYVDDVRPQPFMRAGIDAMLAELDPYTQYLDEADMADMQLMQQRKVGAVGLNMAVLGGKLTVLAPEDNASAYQKGIRTGDIILQIGETSGDGLSTGEAYELLMGQPGTVVSVLIQRGNEPTPRLFVLPRLLPKARNVSFSGFLGADSTEGIGYVRLDVFGNRAAREVKRAFRSLNQSVPLKGMVLDLRGNPGGLLNEAVDLAEIFVPKGSLITSIRTRLDDRSQEYRTDEDPLFPDTPLIVLMDRYSASASEIVAGSLQDYDRAVVMGETSFGKGLVQITRPLPHNTLLKLTVSHYFLPSGRTIQSFELNSASARVASPTLQSYATPNGRTVRGGMGVEPDVAVDSKAPSELETVWEQESAFFLFANTWVERSCRAGVDCVSDENALFDGFMEWISVSGFRFSTRSGQLIGELGQLNEGAGPQVGEALNVLRRELLNQQNESLKALKTPIVKQIQKEIRWRILTESEVVKMDVQQDGWVHQAIDLIRTPSAMQDILR